MVALRSSECTPDSEAEGNEWSPEEREVEASNCSAITWQVLKQHACGIPYNTRVVHPTARPSQNKNNNYWALPNNYYLLFFYLLFANYSQFEEVPIILKIIRE